MATSSFFPALIIPFTAFVGTLLFNYTPLKGLNLIDPKAVTLVLLGCGVIIALVASYVWLRPAALAAVDEGSRLANSIGWAMVLPQMLASLGVIFAAAGVGTTIGALVGAIIPHGSIFLAVVLFRLGHGRVHDDHGQRLRRIPGDGGGDRGPDPDPAGWRQPRGDWRGRNAGRASAER